MDALTLSQPGDVLRGASSSLPPVASSSSAGQATLPASNIQSSTMQGASSSSTATVSTSSGNNNSTSYSPLNLVQQSIPPPSLSSSSSTAAAAASSSSSSSSTSNSNTVGLMYSSFTAMQPALRMIDLVAPASSSDSNTITASVSSAASPLDNANVSPSMHMIKRLKTSNIAHSSYASVTSGSSSSSASNLPLSSTSIAERLEKRLNGILCCAVCMDLPHSSVFQCSNGHLMCNSCFAHLLADSKLRDETATCPSCRCIITRDVCSRNLAVEKAVSEMPGSCRYCERELPRAMLQVHENEECEERSVYCRFSRIGCPWRGPHHELGRFICPSCHLVSFLSSSSSLRVSCLHFLRPSASFFPDPILLLAKCLTYQGHCCSLTDPAVDE